jgi:hypothetical protein
MSDDLRKFIPLHGPAAARPQLDLAEISVDTDTLVANLGDGTATPEQFIMARAQQVLRNKVMAHLMPVSTGVTNAYSIAVATSYLDQLYTGLEITFVPHTANSGPSTVRLNDFDPIPLVDNDAAELVGGELKQTTPVTFIIHDGKAKLKNPSSVLAYNTGNEGGSVVLSGDFEGNVAAGNTVYFNTGLARFSRGDVRDSAKGVYGLRGTHNNIIRTGLYATSTNTFIPGSSYYANPDIVGALTTTPSPVYIGFAVSATKLMVDVRDSTKDDGVAFDPALFDVTTVVGRTVYWSTGNAKFMPGDSAVASRGFLGLRGPDSDIIVHGVYTSGTDDFVPGTHYYADGGANAGKLTATVNGYYVGTAITTRKLLVNVTEAGTTTYISGSKSRIFTLGDGVSDNVAIYVDVGLSNLPGLRYVTNTSDPSLPGKWMYSHNGVAWFEYGVNGGEVLNIEPAGTSVDGESLVAAREGTTQRLMRLLAGTDLEIERTPNGLTINSKGINILSRAETTTLSMDDDFAVIAQPDGTHRKVRLSNLLAAAPNNAAAQLYAFNNMM